MPLVWSSLCDTVNFASAVYDNMTRQPCHLMTHRLSSITGNKNSLPIHLSFNPSSTDHFNIGTIILAEVNALAHTFNDCSSSTCVLYAEFQFLFILVIMLVQVRSNKHRDSRQLMLGEYKRV